MTDKVIDTILKELILRHLYVTKMNYIIKMVNKQKMPHCRNNLQMRLPRSICTNADRSVICGGWYLTHIWKIHDRIISLRWEVSARSLEVSIKSRNEQSCTCLLVVSVSTIILLYFETVLTEWYFWFFIKLIPITILMEYLFCLNQRNHS
jgi:hypothetical protein